jgi:5'-nucleotidase
MWDRIRFVYCDLDDTLLDHSGAERRALREVQQAYPELARLRGGYRLYRRINQMLWDAYGRGEIGREALRKLRFALWLRLLGGDPGRWAEVEAAYLNRYAAHWRWLPGARRAWLSLGRRWPLGLLSNGLLEIQRAKLARFPELQQARVAILAEEVGLRKPDPAIFELALERAGLRAEEVLVIGDSYETDIAPARALGMRTLWIHPNHPVSLPADAIAPSLFAWTRTLQKEHVL